MQIFLLPFEEKSTDVYISQKNKHENVKEKIIFKSSGQLSRFINGLKIGRQFCTLSLKDATYTLKCLILEI